MLKEPQSTSDIIDKLMVAIEARNRDLAAVIAATTAVDAAEISAMIDEHTPNLAKIAEEIAVQQTVSSILDETVLTPASLRVFSDLIDCCLKETLSQTHFLELFEKNLTDVFSQEAVIGFMADRLNSPEAQKDTASVVKTHMQELAKRTDFSGIISERVRGKLEQSDLAALFDKRLKELAKQTDFAALFGERVYAIAAQLDLSAILGMRMVELTGTNSVSALADERKKEFLAICEQALDNLIQKIELESYSHMPWDEFLERTHGSLADDPITRPDYVALDIYEEIE